MRRQFAQILILLGISAAVAGAAAWLHPRAPAWYLTEASDEWDLPVEQVARISGPILWIDARKESEYAAGHMPGAILLNEDRWGELVAENIEQLQVALDRPAVVYCDGSGCERSRTIAERLRQTVGLDRVYVLRGDWRKVPP